MSPKKELVRIVRTPSGEIKIDDAKGKTSGRGAYICGKLECLTMARKKKALERALEVKIDEELYEQLEHQLKGLSING
jgi:hypothetical protein